MENVNEELVINIKITKVQRQGQKSYGYEMTAGKEPKDLLNALTLWLSSDNNDPYAHLIRAIVTGNN